MTEEEKEKLQAMQVEYQALAHAMQTGIAYLMHLDDDKSTDPKHLRVGVNSALCCNGALVELLVNKGLITETEYYETLLIVMRKEVINYERDLAARYGVGTIKLL
jgi:hypothetical protein